MYNPASAYSGGASVAPAYCPVYVVNLDRDHARLAWVGNQLARAGLRFLRVPAVLGSRLTPEALAHHRMGEGSTLTNAEFGCLKSHIRALEAFLSGPATQGLILEDDVHVAADARAAVAQVIASGTLDQFDIIKLEATPMRVVVSNRPRRIDRLKLYRMRGPHFGSGAVLYSRRGAEKALEVLREAKAPSDMALFARPIAGVVVGQLQPAPFMQDRFSPASRIASSIGERPSETLAQDSVLKAMLRPLYLVAFNLANLRKGRMKLQTLFSGPESLDWRRSRSSTWTTPPSSGLTAGLLQVRPKT